MKIPPADAFEAKTITNYLGLKISLAVVSVVLILACCTAAVGIIWYEKYGSNQHRTLINQLAASNCWLAIIFNVVVQTSEIVLSIFGPFNSGFCNWQLFL